MYNSYVTYAYNQIPIKPKNGKDKIFAAIIPATL